jgi:DNA-directed RNA polymerase subunit N (RpoN/RPB10)
MKEIVVEVRCHGCGKLIAKPSDADMELFRLGVHVHNTQECLDKAERKLNRW